VTAGALLEEGDQIALRPASADCYSARFLPHEREKERGSEREEGREGGRQREREREREGGREGDRENGGGGRQPYAPNPAP